MLADFHAVYTDGSVVFDYTPLLGLSPPSSGQGVKPQATFTEYGNAYFLCFDERDRAFAHPDNCEFAQRISGAVRGLSDVIVIGD